MANFDIGTLLKNNAYPGRGIVIGASADGQKAVCAYFIMGRSSNSRNRVFEENGEELVIHPFDSSKLEDPSLIIYYPVRRLGNKLIVTNGDQTDTIYEGVKCGGTFEGALKTRVFEPDSPNYTPRISGMLTFHRGGFKYKMSILKCLGGDGVSCGRYTFEYPAIPGTGHFLHTYRCDGNPIPSFEGEPEPIDIPNDIGKFANTLWSNLNADNKVSLYVRYTDLATGEYETKIFNKNK